MGIGRWVGGGALLAGALLAGAPVCAQDEAATWRVREAINAPLDADTGWAAPAGEAAQVEADRPFRIRFESRGTATGGALALEVRREGGAWEQVEPHDFPYPTRGYEVPPDPAASPWRVLKGSRDGLATSGEGGEPSFRVHGGEEGFVAALPLPWPADSEIAITARLRLPGLGDSVRLLWGIEDAGNHHAALIAGTGAITVIRVEDGAETVLTNARAAITPGQWHEVGIEVDDGALTLGIDGQTAISTPVDARRGLPGLAMSPGAGAQLAELVIEGAARTPGVSIVSAPSYVHGDRTGDLLGGAAAPFVSGSGVSLWDTAPGSAPAGTHSETEWPIIIRRSGDGPVFNENGTLFEFRMIDTADASVAGPVAAVRLVVPKGHLGGTFVETPGRIGPFQASNGDLYFIMEPAETNNRFMMMKSTDGGRSWTEMDGLNRPDTGDLEAVDARLVGDRIVILHQVTRSVRFHTFRTSDHPAAPDSWEIRDEVAAEARAVAQMATIAPRSDGSVVAVFLADDLFYVVRSPDGRWSQPLPIGGDEGGIGTGPQAAVAADDTVHLAYASADGRIWFRCLLPGGAWTGAWTGRFMLAEDAGSGRPAYGAVLPLVVDGAAGTARIAYRLADGSLWERQATCSGAMSEARRIAAGPVVTDAVDSQQAGADLVSVPGGGLVALFIDEATRSISSASWNGSAWTQPVVRVGGIEGSWVRGSAITSSDGRVVLAVVYDAGSRGGTGLNRFITWQRSLEGGEDAAGSP